MADLPPEVRDDIGLLEGHCESFQWLTPVVQNVRNYCERVTAERDEYKVRAERAEIAQVDVARESICEVATHNKSVHDYMIHWESRTKHAEEEADELRASLKLRTSADARAIAAWRVAHPGNDLIQPDYADLCVWLADRAEKAESERDALRKRIAEAPKACMSGDAHIVMLTGEMYLHIHEPCFKFEGFPGKRVPRWWCWEMTMANDQGNRTNPRSG